MTAARRRAAPVRSSRHNRAWARCFSRWNERASRAIRSTAIPPPATGANASRMMAASAQFHEERKNPSRARETRTSSSASAMVPKVPTRNTLPLWTTCALQRPRLGNTPRTPDAADKDSPTDRLYGIASAHAICPSKPSVFAMSR
jgi:hypothetical protein